MSYDFIRMHLVEFLKDIIRIKEGISKELDVNSMLDGITKRINFIIEEMDKRRIKKFKSDELSIESKSKEVCIKVFEIISRKLKIEHLGILEDKIGIIMRTISEKRPLAAGSVFIELASLLQEIAPDMYRELVRDCYVIAFEIAIEKLVSLATEQEQKRKKNNKKESNELSKSI